MVDLQRIGESTKLVRRVAELIHANWYQYSVLSLAGHLQGSMAAMAAL